MLKIPGVKLKTKMRKSSLKKTDKPQDLEHQEQSITVNLADMQMTPSLVKILEGLMNDGELI